MTDALDSKTIHVLHVLSSMNRGGIETWLMQVLQRIDRHRFQLDFCCLSGEAGLYAPEIEALGSRIFPCRLTRNLLSFNQKFSRILRATPYCVVHSHVHYFSGYILWRAAQTGTKIRIAHSFTAPSATHGSLSRWGYFRLMSWMIERYATVGLGNSSESMQSLYGTNWPANPHRRLMYLGIDVKPFARIIDRTTIRRQYGIPSDALIIGHVGRLTEAKNQRFLIDVEAEIEPQHDNIWLLLVGDGSLRADLVDYARRKRITHLVMTGSVAETQSLYGIMDLFVFPSLWEGLPQAVGEAQAAGLRCLCSDSITSEVSIVAEAVRFMPLGEGPTKWAAACFDLLHLPKLDRNQARETLSASPFAIDQSVAELSSLYSSAEQ